MNGSKVLGARRWLERVAIGPLGFAALFSFAVRSAQTFSFGAFSIAHLPPPLPFLIEMLSGFAMAFTCEIIGSAGLGKWWALLRLSLDIPISGVGNKKMRELQATKFRVESRLHLGYGIAGILCTLYAGIAFANTIGSHDFLTNFVAMGFAIVAITYIFVFYEPEKAHPLAEVFEIAEGGVKNVMGAIGVAISKGEHTPEQVRSLQVALKKSGSSDQADMLEPLIAHDPNLTYLSLTEIRRMLDRDDTAGERYVRRMVQNARDLNPDGIRQRQNGRGWEVSQARFGEIFADDIAGLAGAINMHRGAAMRMYRENQTLRTTTGQEPATPPGAVSLAAHFTGQSPDTRRTEQL